LAIPFWVGTTAYLNGQQWIDLSTPPRLHAYLLGISLGTLTLLIILAYLAQKIVTQIQHKTTLQRIPGIVLLGLGLYAFFQYLF
jgi:uncharacterized membrane protein YdjX (TVP38/TMEM64 family)